MSVSFIVDINGVSVQSPDADGYSAVGFLDNAGVNRMVIGHGNGSSGVPNESYIITQNGGNTPADFAMYTYQGGTKRQALRMCGNGDVVLGAPGMAADATAGFVFVPYCMGAPTGTTADHSGTVPMIVDMSNERLYVRVGNVWKSAQLL